jgi:hypothetical protein
MLMKEEGYCLVAVSNNVFSHSLMTTRQRVIAHSTGTAAFCREALFPAGFTRVLYFRGGSRNVPRIPQKLPAVAPAWTGVLEDELNTSMILQRECEMDRYRKKNRVSREVEKECLRALGHNNDQIEHLRLSSSSDKRPTHNTHRLSWPATSHCGISPISLASSPKILLCASLSLGNRPSLFRTVLLCLSQVLFSPAIMRANINPQRPWRFQQLYRRQDC